MFVINLGLINHCVFLMLNLVKEVSYGFEYV